MSTDYARIVHESAFPPEQPIDPTRRYRCRHVFTDGHRCGSPALRGQELCYYHGRTRTLGASAGRSHTFQMSRIDDRNDIQIALFDVLTRVAAGDIEYKRGSVLLYGLQIASSNLARRDQQNAQHPLVEEITRDYDLGDLAPREEFRDPPPQAVLPPDAPSADKAAHRTPARPPRRNYTEEEKSFLKRTTTIMSYAPADRPRMESITDDDIIGAINANRRVLRLGPVEQEPNWNPATLSARAPATPPQAVPTTPPQAVPATAPHEKQVVILSEAKNPRISPEAPANSAHETAAAPPLGNPSLQAWASPSATKTGASAPGVAVDSFSEHPPHMSSTTPDTPPVAPHGRNPMPPGTAPSPPHTIAA